MRPAVPSRHKQHLDVHDRCVAFMKKQFPFPFCPMYIISCYCYFVCVYIYTNIFSMAADVMRAIDGQV